MNGLVVNDTHSQLNPTPVSRLIEPRGLDEIVALVREARTAGAQLAICGARHAMGGQQFASDSWLVDLRQHAMVHHVDQERGWVVADAGICWPELIAGCVERQERNPTARTWGIRQKQTGADQLTLGGALAANIHGRGLRMPPIIGDVEAFTLVDANGDVRHCSRTQDAELFRLAIGGYGLFGIIADVTLRLMPRVRMERRVEVITMEELLRVPEERDTTSWLFGDFQFSIDEKSPDFLRRGVFSAYHRLDDDDPRPVPAAQRTLGAEDWRRLLHLAHTDRARGFAEYARYYLSTDGQLYWSDTHQLGTYIDGYHAEIDQHLAAAHRSSEMITEIYVPRPALGSFLQKAAELFRRTEATVIYGTIRLVERDTESFLAWARGPWACIIFNVCVAHTPSGLSAAQTTFRALIDLAIEFQGSYYLTYHRWAARAQVEACHPQFREFLQLKEKHDPETRFTSDWYRHYRKLFT